MKKKSGFTLAELMIVLAILGVIAAILTPTIFDAMPDENRLRFKKAYYTLQRTTDAVLNSEAYPEGDMSQASNAAVTFCNVFSDMLNTIYDDCASSKALKPTTQMFEYKGSSTLSTLDGYCASQVIADPLGSATKDYPKFVTQDGIFWWGFDYGFNTKKEYNEVRSDYSVICIDVDGTGPTKPFAFGVRNDGKVVVGKTARDWLKEGIKSAVQTED